MLPVELTFKELYKLVPGTVILRKKQKINTDYCYLEEVVFKELEYTENRHIVRFDYLEPQAWSIATRRSGSSVVKCFYPGARYYDPEIFYHRPTQLIYNEFDSSRYYSYIHVSNTYGDKTYCNFAFGSRDVFESWKIASSKLNRIFDVKRTVFSYHRDHEFHASINAKPTSENAYLNEASKSDHVRKQGNPMIVVPNQGSNIVYDRSAIFSLSNQTTPTKGKSFTMSASTNWNVYRVVAQLVPNRKAQAQGKAPRVLLVDDIQAISTQDAERIALAKVLRKYRDIDPLRIHINVN